MSPPSNLSAPDAPAWLEALPVAAWLVALPEQRTLALNARAVALLGAPAASGAAALAGARATELAASPEDLAWWEEAARGQASPLDSVALLALLDGRTLHARRCIALLDDGGPAGERRALVTLFGDAAAAHAAGDAAAATPIEAELADLRAALESAPAGLLVTDMLGHVQRCNRRFAELWRMPLPLLAEGDPAATAAWMQRAVADAADYAERLDQLRNAPLADSRDEVRLLSGVVLQRVSRPLLRDGVASGRVWAFHEASAAVAGETGADAAAEGAAATDALTLLPNRHRLGAIVQAVLRGQADAAALLVVDLDRFGRINDILGHEGGDRVLQEVASRLSSCLREDDVLGRLGNDQFAVVLHTGDAGAAQAIARRMLNAVAQPCCIDGHTFTLTCSIGIAIGPAHGATASELLAHAEAATADAKRAGRADVRTYQARGSTDRRSQMRLEHAMRTALVSGGFRLNYQPQIDLAQGHIVGAEALLRWRDPQLGDVPPGRFIPVAEDSGFIVAIGDWVLAQAVRQATLWHEAGHELPVAVNVSALQFNQASFVERVADVLAVSALPPHLLELELTESILVHDADEALARLTALARLGLQLSIDDFGTGYSSLAYLKRFPIGKLKIDRSFVQGLPGDGTDAGIVRAILQMARALEKTVIAEGVETEAQREFLLREGCEQMQGFLYAGALEVKAFEQRLAAGAGGRSRLRLVHG